MTEEDRRYEQHFAAIEYELRREISLLRDEIYRHAQLNMRDTDRSERAMEARFQSVNEFRAQLSDQATRFLTRDEYDTQHLALEEKTEAEAVHLQERLHALELRVTSRLDISQGTISGSHLTMANLRAAIVASTAVLTIILTMVVLVANGKL